MCVFNSQWLKFNAVNSQSLENQCGQWPNAEKSWSKFLLAVAAMTIDSVGVTPPCRTKGIAMQSSVGKMCV